MTKTFIRFFTIADYIEEEEWLREQHKEGWKVVKFTPPCFYLFESCQPDDVIYRLDFKNSEETPEYMQMCRDFGWENIAKSLGWLYFRKPASSLTSPDEGELFSDAESKADMISHIVRSRMLPLVCIFFCCVMPNLLRIIFRDYCSAGDIVLAFLFGILFAVYLYLFIHCGRKLRKLKKNCEKK